MAAKRLDLLALSVTVTAALAGWVSGGALTVASAQPRAPRLGLLPSPRWLALLVVVAVICAAILGRRSRRASGLALSTLVLLPWLPSPVPPAFFVWTGPLRIWLWTLIVAALVLPAASRWRPAAIVRNARDPQRAPWLAAAVAAVAYLAGAYQIFPQLPAGDEPHYLVIAQSLLRDRDLKIENNHRQGDYRAYYPGDLKPDYLRRGTDGEIYSIHAPGLPVVVLPVFALFGYPGVLALLAVASAIATALAWIAVWRVTSDAAASWFGWAAVALSAPFFYQSFIVYPDALGGAIVMLGVVTLIEGLNASMRRLAVTGLALSTLPWLHTRFAILAVALAGLILARQLAARDFLRRALALIAMPAVSAACWFGFFYVVYGTPDPRAPYGGYTQSAMANLPSGIVGLLFDQQFGLVANAPVYLCAAVGLLVMARRATRLAIEMLVLLVPYGLVVAEYQLWWGGYSSAARFLVPVLLPLAIPAGVWFKARRGRATRMLGGGGLAVSLLMTTTIALVDRGALLYNVRDGSSRLLLWLSPLVNLTTGLPSLFQTGPVAALANAAIWLCAIATAAAVGWLMARGGANGETVAVSLGFATAGMAMIALSIVWRAHGGTPLTPTTGSVAFLQRDDRDGGQIGLRYAPLRLMPGVDVAPALTLVDWTPGARSADAPLLNLPRPPAATYGVEAVLSPGASGAITVTLDRKFGPVWSWDITGERGAWRRDVHLPVAAPALLVDADPVTRRGLERLSIRAVSVVGSRERLVAGEPDHVTRYGPAVAFLMRGHAYMERAGTWVVGGKWAEFVIAPDDRSSVRLFVRNPPVENRVTLESDGWRRELVLKPGEERLLDVPVASGRAAVRLRVSAERGVRPTEFEPGSTDVRFLGCWIETR